MREVFKWEGETGFIEPPFINIEQDDDGSLVVRANTAQIPPRVAMEMAVAISTAVFPFQKSSRSDVAVGASHDAQIEPGVVKTGTYAPLEANPKVHWRHDKDYRCTNGHDRCYMGSSPDCPYCEPRLTTSALDGVSVEDALTGGSR